jgi:hypothetical protein
MSYRSIYSGQEIDLILSSIKNKIDNSGSYTVANLPSSPVPTEGTIAFASNGRKAGELAGQGTGVPVYFSHGAWRVFSTDVAVAS